MKLQIEHIDADEVGCHIQNWLAHNLLAPIEVDCVAAVMLKILDGKCKMAADEKNLMAELYHQVKSQSGLLLGSEIHDLIQRAGDAPDGEMRNLIYEQRVLAETHIARPTMKAFKARLRESGLLEVKL